MLTLTHTPGAVLDRPDQVSRGAAMEEPRARLNEPFFSAVSSAFGPFTEYLGSEREHASGPPSPGGSRLFCHPTHSTVGTTLRMVGDRMLNRDGGRVSGLVVLPNTPEAQWWKLTRHMATVALLPSGPSASHLECNLLGRWLPFTPERRSLIVAFPRSAGRGGYPLVESARRFDDGGIDSGYSSVDVDGGSRLLHSLPVGAIVFAAPESAGEPGALYMLEEPYSPVDSTIPMTLMAVRLLRDSRQCVTRTCDPAALPFLIDSTQSYRGRGKDRASQPFALDVRKLFIATPYTSELEIPRSKTKGWERTKRYFHFNSTACLAFVARRSSERSSEAPWPDDSDDDDGAALALESDVRELGKKDVELVCEQGAVTLTSYDPKPEAMT